MFLSESDVGQKHEEESAHFEMGGWHGDDVSVRLSIALRLSDALF